jgi:hypothetical protein
LESAEVLSASVNIYKGKREQQKKAPLNPKDKRKLKKEKKE